MSRASQLGFSILLLALAAPAQAADVTVKLDAGSGFVIQNNAGAIERLRVHEATGNLSRNGALFVHTTGSDNLFVGPGAGNTGTSGVGRNTAFGTSALSSNTTGYANSAFGNQSLQSNTTGEYNSAFGDLSLRSNTIGDGNSAFGVYALEFNTSGFHNSALGFAALMSNTTGNFNSAVGLRAMHRNTTGTSNSAFGSDALANNTTGTYNSAFGRQALNTNTASNNAAFGSRALYKNTTGASNSAFGRGALEANTTGASNSAVGHYALVSNTGGGGNAAVGLRALNFNTTGNSNTAIGTTALFYNTSGNSNVALGHDAGAAQTTGSHNIYIANVGVAGEGGQIKIGNTNHTDTFIEGIFGNTSSGGTAVFINASNELGTATSSIRFKEAVRDMGEASEKLRQLRPVVFRYHAEEGQAASGEEYGLIAEEVAAVAPELVVNDAEGRPYSVRYHVLPALLLNELQEQQRTIEGQQRAIQGLVARVAELERRPGGTASGVVGR